jgi:ATP-dependent Clp protease ATP-binding subunit ClpB
MKQAQILGMDLANLKEDRNKIFAKWKSEKRRS